MGTTIKEEMAITAAGLAWWTGFAALVPLIDHPDYFASLPYADLLAFAGLILLSILGGSFILTLGTIAFLPIVGLQALIKRGTHPHHNGVMIALALTILVAGYWLPLYLWPAAITP